MPLFFDQHSLPIIAGDLGGAISVADRAALAAYDDADVRNGGLAYIETYRDYFEKVVTADVLTLDPNVAVPTSSGDGYWLRLTARSPYWQSVASWYIDTAGDDENSGASSAPLASFAEFARRVQQINGTVTVNIMSDLAEALSGHFEALAPDARLLIAGDPNIIIPSADITLISAPDPSAAVNDYGILKAEDGAPIQWNAIGSSTKNFVEVIDAPVSSRVGLQTIIFDVGGSPEEAATPFWANVQTSGDVVLPAVGDKIRVFQTRVVNSVQIDAPSVIVQIRYLSLASRGQFSFVNANERALVAPLIRSGYFGCSIEGAVYNCSNLGFFACFVRADMYFQMYGNASVSFISCGFTDGFEVETPSPIIFDGTIIKGGSGLYLGDKASSVLIKSNGLGCFNARGDGLRVMFNAAVAVAGPLYGKNNTAYGLRCLLGGTVQVIPAISEPAALSLTGASNDILLDPPAGLVAPNVAPIVAGVPVGSAACGTWAQWTAINRQAVNLVSGSRISG